MSAAVSIIALIVLGIVCVIGASVILSGRDTIGGDMVMEEWRASRDLGRKVTSEVKR